MVTDDEAAEMRAVADDMAQQREKRVLRMEGKCVARIGDDMLNLLAERERTLGLAKLVKNDRKANAEDLARGPRHTQGGWPCRLSTLTVTSDG